ncbi:tetratricopeptide repeat-containing sensor histidine kinase [Algoriphagus mannitolivorans]|uniref:tetratricopeptide repeat-containing sensor histidine kinase n=1 Tax=Algoriphagus mannitolivorans TaxID=226504 RepID=UPI00040C9DBC|nr:tetratricopeptide repeat protein [Algoriphagus mannitolivorans]
MKRYFLLIGLIFFLADEVLAQSAIDSLQIALKKTGNKDTVRVQLYNELAWEWAGSNPQIGLLFADSAYQLAQKLQFESGKIAAMNRKGVNYWYSGQDSLAIKSYEVVLDYHLRNQNRKGQGTTINNIALLYYNQNDFKKALEFHHQATEIFEELGLRKNIINSLSNEGVVFLALADYPNAKSLFLRALGQTGEEDTWERGNLYNNLGLVEKNLRNYPKAEEYYLQGLELYRKTGNLSSEAGVLGNLSALKQLQNQMNEAESYINQALELNLKLGNPRKIASDLSNLGALKSSLGQFPVAEKALDSARVIYEFLDEKLLLSSVLLQLAKVGDLQGKSPQVGYLLEKEALKKAQSSGSLDALQHAWKALSDRQELLGEFRESLISFRNYSLYKDSIFNRENEKKLLKAQLGHEFDQKEKQITEVFEMEKALLEYERNQERWKVGFLLFAAASILAIGILVFFFLRRQSIVRQKELEASFRAQMVDLELKALRAQMNPHFIFNALGSISNFLLKNQPDEADRYLTKFSRLIRRILEYSEKREISLAQELELLEDYIALETLRMGKSVDFRVINSENMDFRHIEIPPLLLQPLVENSLWHGIAYTSYPGEILLEITSEMGSLILTLRDNGEGQEDVVRLPYKASSMGLSLVKSRLDHLDWNSKKGNSESLRCEKREKGFEVQLRIAKTLAKMI